MPPTPEKTPNSIHYDKLKTFDVLYGQKFYLNVLLTACTTRGLILWRQVRRMLIRDSKLWNWDIYVILTPKGGWRSCICCGCCLSCIGFCTCCAWGICWLGWICVWDWAWAGDWSCWVASFCCCCWYSSSFCCCCCCCSKTENSSGFSHCRRKGTALVYFDNKREIIWQKMIRWLTLLSPVTLL